MTSDILANGLKQAVEANAPREMILALKCEIMQAALTRIAATGGNQGIIAIDTLEIVKT